MSTINNTRYKYIEVEKSKIQMKIYNREKLLNLLNTARHPAPRRYSKEKKTGKEP